MATQPFGIPPSGAPADSGTQTPPSQAPANPQQVVLAQIYQLLKKIGMDNPVLSSGIQKALSGIQEAQTAMITGAAPQPVESTPPY